MIKIGNAYFSYAAVHASGAGSFFGHLRPDDYKQHKWFKFFFPKGFKLYDKVTFCAKTVTAFSRKGNMLLESNGTSVSKFWPDCVGVTFVSFLRGAMVNAIGLSNMGIEEMFKTGLWQERTEPFMISFMSLATEQQELERELDEFVRVWELYSPGLKTQVALQVNLSCPNTGHNLDTYLESAFYQIERLRELGIPLIPKIGLDTAWEFVDKLCACQDVSALCITNTKPWNSLNKWQRILWFGRLTSPVAKYGGGGVSGKILFKEVHAWIQEYERRGGFLPLIQSGGIINSRDAKKIAVFDSVAMVSIGSVAILRPGRVSKIVRAINEFCK
jgi:dihydroorotate dehydrogenase